jgi:hypothetical protein
MYLCGEYNLTFYKEKYWSFLPGKTLSSRKMDYTRISVWPHAVIL